jgi:hypothetical protein
MKLFFSVFIVYVLALTANGQENDRSITHYIFPEFYAGKILMKNGNTEKSRLNYNSLMEEMAFETKGKYLALINVGVIDTVYIQNRKFSPVVKVFYEVTVNMKKPLLIKHTCRVIPPGKPTAYGGTSENNFIRIYKVKQVIRHFPDKEEEIIKFVKLNGTDFDNQKDVIDLIIFCNK